MSRRSVLLGSSIVCLGLMPVHSIAATDSANEFLDMDISQLMDITITSVSKKEQRLSDAAAAIFVITQEDIHTSGVTHIAEALAMAPGIQVAKISASKWSVSSRGFAGFTSNKLLVLVDGRSVYTPAYSGTFWDMQNTLLEDVDRIEVIRGPGGTLWGANAVNGVINIITKKSSDTQGGLVRAGVGDQERVQGAARYGWQLNDSTNGRIYLTYNDRGSNTLGDLNGGDANDGWQSYQGGFRFDGGTAASSEWTLQGDIYQNKGDQIIYPFWTTTPPYLTANFDDLDSSGANLLGRFKQEFEKDSTLIVQAYYDYNDRDDEFYRQTFNTFDLDVQYQTALGERNALTMGTGYRRIDGEFEPTSQFQLEDSMDDLFNVFLQDEIKLIDDALWLTLGVKWEHNEYTEAEWQPSGRLLYKPADNHSIWGSIARAVRTPSILEQKGRLATGVAPTPFGVAPIAFKGNENFDSEVVVAYEMGYRWQPTSSLSTDFAIFYNDYDDLYSLRPSLGMDGISMNFINGTYGDSHGFEAAVDWKAASWLSMIFTYSYLDSEFTIENDDEVGELNGLFSAATPKHQASLRSSIDIADNMQVNLWLRYVDEISTRSTVEQFAVPHPIDEYLLFDANLAWSPIDNLEFMLVGQNLLNSSQLQYSSILYTPATEIERSVYVKLTYRF
ncbi:MAG: TonB-dependent receptor plug domain-containing protein [Desulforhopalus sp.]